MIGDSGGNLTRKACGFLFDSEVVDKAAATALERLYPHLTNMPCQAHCSISLMKVHLSEMSIINRYGNISVSWPVEL